MSESALQTEIRLALGARKDCVFFRNNVGIADTGGRKIRYGLCKGSSDLIGFLRPSGRIVALEIKIPGGKMSEDQKRFLALVNLSGGYARMVDSIQSAHAAVDAAHDTANAWMGKTYTFCAKCQGKGTYLGTADGEYRTRKCERCFGAGGVPCG